MRNRAWVCFILLLPALALAAQQRPAGPGSPYVAEVAGYRVVLERIVQSRPSPPERGAGGQRLTGRPALWLTFLVQAPTPEAALRVEGLTGPFLAETSDGTRLEFATHHEDIAAQPKREQWQGYLVAHDADASLAALERLAARLRVSEWAEVARLEFPLAEELPQRRATREYSVELQAVRRLPGEFGAILEARWPEGVTERPWSSEAPYGISASGPGDAPLPHRDAIGQSLGVEDGWHRWRYELVWELEDTPPERVVVETLLRGGERRLLPFELKEVELPAALAESRPESWPDLLDRTLPPGFPLRAPPETEGGGIVLSAVPPRPGVFGLGLSRWDGERWSAWRWLSMPADERGRAEAAPLLPGRYRAQRLWGAVEAGAAASWQEGTGEILILEVPAGERVAFPPAGGPDDR